MRCDNERRCDISKEVLARRCKFVELGNSWKTSGDIRLKKTWTPLRKAFSTCPRPKSQKLRL